jgi:precorrin-2 dehydrogenase/sirohydrochlorin ferrochelatase
MLPLLHDLADERVLVVGGGSVAARKASYFATEATVVVLARSFDPDVSFGGVASARVRVALSPPDVRAWIDRIDPALVVAATDDAALNDALEAAAREAGALVNRADHRGGRAVGSVAVPATTRSGDVVVGVGTDGRSPALAASLRDRIETTVDDLAHAEEMASLTDDLRAELTAAGVPAADRRRALRTIVGSREVWTAFHTPGSNPREIAADVISDVIGDQP